MNMMMMIHTYSFAANLLSHSFQTASYWLLQPLLIINNYFLSFKTAFSLLSPPSALFPFHSTCPFAAFFLISSGTLANFSNFPPASFHTALICIEIICTTLIAFLASVFPLWAFSDCYQLAPAAAFALVTVLKAEIRVLAQEYSNPSPRQYSG